MSEKNITISEHVDLPSEGKVYLQTVVPTIELKSMTTAHEMKRLSPSEHPYLTLCEILDDCMVNNPGISSYDMCLGDYQFLLYRLRTVTYGPDYAVVSTCPYCMCNNKLTINLDEVGLNIYDEESISKYQEFELPVSKRRIKLRFQTPRLLDIIDEREKEFRKKAATGINQTLMFTIEQMIEEMDGRKPDPILLTEWVRNLPMADTNTIINYANKLNTSIGIDTTFDNVCGICGLDYTGIIKTTSEFFRPALDI